MKKIRFGSFAQLKGIRKIVPLLAVLFCIVIHPLSARAESASRTVYVSSSHKYHFVSDCSGMKNYTTMTLQQAQSKGYEACKNCVTDTTIDKDPVSSSPFIDVTAGDEVNHASDIFWMADEGISEGWSTAKGKEFRGMQNVKRCDLAAFLFRMAKNRGVVTDSWQPSEETKTKFTDVTSSTPHAREVWWMAESGISKGWTAKDGTTTFRPYATVARQDVAAFLRRYASMLGNVEIGPQPLEFKDVTAGDTVNHASEVNWLGSWSITTGWQTNNGREFRGLLPVKRQDLAAFLHRLYENVPEAHQS